MKAHTADEATLDGEIPNQDLISVSTLKLKIEIEPKLIRDYLLEIILFTSAPPPINQCLPQQATATLRIGRERSRENKIK